MTYVDQGFGLSGDQAAGEVILTVTDPTGAPYFLRFPTFVYEGNFSGWLRVVGRNAWIDSVKTQHRVARTGDTAIRERLENVDETELARLLPEHEGWEKLPESQLESRRVVHPASRFHLTLPTKWVIYMVTVPKDERNRPTRQVNDTHPPCRINAG